MLAVWCETLPDGVDEKGDKLVPRSNLSNPPRLSYGTLYFTYVSPPPQPSLPCPSPRTSSDPTVQCWGVCHLSCEIQHASHVSFCEGILEATRDEKSASG